MDVLFNASQMLADISQANDSSNTNTETTTRTTRASTRATTRASASVPRSAPRSRGSRGARSARSVTEPTADSTEQSTAESIVASTAESTAEPAAESSNQSNGQSNNQSENQSVTESNVTSSTEVTTEAPAPATARPKKRRAATAKTDASGDDSMKRPLYKRPRRKKKVITPASTDQTGEESKDQSSEQVEEPVVLCTPSLDQLTVVPNRESLLVFTTTVTPHSRDCCFSSTFKSHDGEVYWEMRTEPDRNQFFKISHGRDEAVVGFPIIKLAMQDQECPELLSFVSEAEKCDLDRNTSYTQFRISVPSRFAWKSFMKANKFYYKGEDTVQGQASIIVLLKDDITGETERRTGTIGVRWRTTRDAKRRSALLCATGLKDKAKTKKIKQNPKVLPASATKRAEGPPRRKPSELTARINAIEQSINSNESDEMKQQEVPIDAIDLSSANAVPYQPFGPPSFFSPSPEHHPLLNLSDIHWNIQSANQLSQQVGASNRPASSPLDSQMDFSSLANAVNRANNYSSFAMVAPSNHFEQSSSFAQMSFHNQPSPQPIITNLPVYQSLDKPSQGEETLKSEEEHKC